MNIIVEGVDGSGKSSLISNLEKLTGRKVIKGSSFEISAGGADAMFEQSKQILLENEDVIIDRFFYSNIVYGKMYGYPTMTKEQYAELNNLVSERAVVYELVADTDVIIKRINKRGDNMINVSDIEKIQKAYAEMWKECEPRNLIVIETDNDDLLDIESEIYQTIIAHDKEMSYIAEEFSQE